MARLFLTPPHAAKTDMAQVLHPLKVGDCHTARVGIHIRNDHAAFLAEHLISTCRNRPVRRLDDQRRLDPLGIAKVDNPFQRRWNKDVAVFFQHKRAIRNICRIRKARDAAMLHNPAVHRVHIKPIRVHKRTVALNDPRDQRSVLVAQELRRMVAHIAQALHNDALAV